MPREEMKSVKSRVEGKTFNGIFVRRVMFLSRGANSLTKKKKEENTATAQILEASEDGAT